MGDVEFDSSRRRFWRQSWQFLTRGELVWSVLREASCEVHLFCDRERLVIVWKGHIHHSCQHVKFVPWMLNDNVKGQIDATFAIAYETIRPNLIAKCLELIAIQRPRTIDRGADSL